MIKANAEFSFEILNHIQDIDNIKHNQFVFGYEIEDLEFSQMVEFGLSNGKLKIQDLNCQSNVLMIEKESKFSKIQGERSPSFIKNQCQTYLVIFQEEIEFLDVENEPYFFALKQDKEKTEIHEVQVYSKKIIPLITLNKTDMVKMNQNIFQRRSDFNGAKVRLVESSSDNFQGMLLCPAQSV